MAPKKQKTDGAPGAETAQAPPPAETAEGAKKAKKKVETWECPTCGSSYRVEEDAVAIVNHKAWHGVA